LGALLLRGGEGREGERWGGQGRGGNGKGKRRNDCYSKLFRPWVGKWEALFY